MSETEQAFQEAAPEPTRLELLAREIAAALGSDTGMVLSYGEITVTLGADVIIPALIRLRDAPSLSFTQLIDLTAVDYPERAKRFDVVYHLLSLSRNARVRLRVEIEEDDVVPSAIEAYPTANWLEREIFDMFGIAFTDHPDLRRILTDYGFQGHPLRKDFPMTGHVEVRYDMELRRVVYEPVKLTQDFRSFDFMSPWEGAPYILPGDEKAQGQG